MIAPDLVGEALLIRLFEEELLDLYRTGVIGGTVHTAIGQEWVSVAAGRASAGPDFFFSNHRCHGHFISRVGDVSGLMAEIMGREKGVCRGYGGSQHLHGTGFLSNGIVGGMAPIAVGWALGEALRGGAGISFLFLGDGALGEGVVYEALNLGSRWGAPVLLVLENNGISQSSEQETTLAGSIEARAAAFGIDYLRASTWEVEGLLETFREAAARVRTVRAPLLLQVDTFRLAPHSKGDDLRSPESLARYSSLDPLNRFRAEFSQEAELLVREVRSRIDEAVRTSREATAGTFDPASRRTSSRSTLEWESARFQGGRRHGELLNETLGELLEHDERVLLIGEDIEDPYGGAFKITRGLSTRFPGRVRNTPISEAGIIGVGTGLALAGHVVIVEIMFGDFLGLCFDQLLNHACKFRFSSGGALRVPLIVRTPMGGYRGYGPTHSQAIERHFLGIPDLTILALNGRLPPGVVYRALSAHLEGPTLVVENKTLYARPLMTRPLDGFEVLVSNEDFPTMRIAPIGREPDVTLFCYGDTLALAEEVLEIAFDEREITCEILCPSVLVPFAIEPLLPSLARSRRLVTIEEGGSVAALGSEVCARVLESGVELSAFTRVGCDSFVPASMEMERQALPSRDRVLEALSKVTRKGSRGR